MEVITAIRKGRGKMHITVNDCEEIQIPFALFRERPLQEGQPINLEEYDQWLLLRQYRHALDRAVGYLASRAHSRKEIEDKLYRAGYRPCTVEMVIYKLEKEKLLNDADFARQWVESRTNRKMGQRRIAMELRRKGVSASETEDALAELSSDDQLEAAVSLAEKAMSRSKAGEDPRKTANRIAGMLVRRGYSWDLAREAISRVCSAADDID